MILRKIVKPILSILEKTGLSPARFHSDEVHKTNFNAIETDDPSLLFRFFDGFFLYAFILSWSKDDLLDWFQPKITQVMEELEVLIVRLIKIFQFYQRILEISQIYIA